MGERMIQVRRERYSPVDLSPENLLQIRRHLLEIEASRQLEAHSEEHKAGETVLVKRSEVGGRQSSPG